MNDSGQIKLNSIQQSIFERLREQTISSKNLKDMYLSAHVVLNNKSNPERYHQSAHSLRELTYYLTDNIEIPSEELDERRDHLKSIYSQIKNSPDFNEISKQTLKNVIDNLEPEKPSHKIKIKTLIENLDELAGIPKESIVNQWYKLHNYFVMLCHHRTNVAQIEVFEENLLKLEYILLALLCPVYESIDELDKIMIKDTPTQNDIEKVKSLLKSTSQTNYFFLRLNKAGWLLPLAVNGFFDNPPMIGGYSVEPVYIRKVIDKLPDESIEIIKKLAQTNHLGAQVEFLKAIIQIPSDYSTSLIKYIHIWIHKTRGYSSALHNQLTIYVKKLFKEGFKEEGLKLSKSLFALKREPLSGSDEKIIFGNLRNNDGYFYKTLVRELYEVLCENTPIETIKLFCNILKKIIEISEDLLNGSDEKDDLSIYWRTSIKTEEQQYEKNDFRNVVVSTIRDALDFILSNRSDLIENLLGIVKSFEYSIFKRMELYLYTNYPRLTKSYIERYILSKTEFDDLDRNLEMQSFLKVNYDVLNLTEKKKYIEWVNLGPNVSDFIEGFNLSHQSGPGEEIIEIYKKNWMKEKLSPIIDFLNPKEIERFGFRKEDFIKKNEEIFDDLSFLPTSPKTINELKDMDKGTLVDLIVSSNSNNNDFKALKEGLGRNIRKIILETPKTYIPYLEVLRNNPKTHYIISDFINGFNSALDKLDNIDIIPIIELCEAYIIKNTKLEVSSSFYDSNPKRNFKIQIAWLIENLFRKDKVDYDLAERILILILKLLEDVEPEHNNELSQEMNNRLLQSLMSNTIRGVAMDCFFIFIRWYKNKKFQIENVKIDNLGDLFPSISETLEKYLNFDFEKTFTIRYIFGIYLNDLILLDSKWFKSNYQRIIPNTKEFLQYWDATMAGFLDFSKVSSISYDMIKQEFRKIIDLSFIDPPNLIFLSISKFIENLMLLYVEGIETLENDESLVNVFFNIADDDSRKIAMRYLGTKLILLNERDDIEIIIPRLKKLISNRIEVIKQGNIDNYKNEISSLIYWYRESIFDHSFTIYILNEYLELSQGDIDVFYDVLDKAGTFFDSFPEAILDNIYKILKNELAKNNYLIYIEKYRKIFIKGLNNRNIRVNNKTREIINFVGSKGIHDFRDLL